MIENSIKYENILSMKYLKLNYRLRLVHICILGGNTANQNCSLAFLVSVQLMMVILVKSGKFY